MTKEKKPLKVSLKTIVIQLGIIVFFTVVWLSGLIFNIGFFDIWYFLIMFLALIGFVVIVLYSKGNSDQPISKIPAQHFTNLIKAITDSITIQTTKLPVIEFKNNIKNALVSNLRWALITEFDRETIKEGETYMFDKLSKKREE